MELIGDLNFSRCYHCIVALCIFLIFTLPRKVIKNILGIFTFQKKKTFISNPNKEIKPAINVVPESLKFKVVKDDFKLSHSFNGWLIAEVSGLKKGIRVE